MKTFKEIRKINYEHRKVEEKKFSIDIDDWFRSPYTTFKLRYYIEASNILVYLLQFTKITPNQVSIFYAFLGLLSGLLMAFNDTSLIFIGLVIFILKGAFDATDGLLARITDRTSNIGHVTDIWGSHVGYYSLIFGLGMISFNFTQEIIYVKILLFIFLISLIDFKLFGYHQLFYEILNKKINFVKNDLIETNPKKEVKKNLMYFLKLFLRNFLDDRARTLDLICLIIFIEIINEKIFLINIILILFLIKKIILLFGNITEIIILDKFKDKF